MKSRGPSEVGALGVADELGDEIQRGRAGQIRGRERVGLPPPPERHPARGAATLENGPRRLSESARES